MTAIPALWLIAGPKRVGKTIFAMTRLEAISGSINFVNFDEISRGLSPLTPEAAEREAARIALSRIAHFIASGATFALETTLSGKAQLRLIEQAHKGGLAANLLYFSARTRTSVWSVSRGAWPKAATTSPKMSCGAGFHGASPTCPPMSERATSGASTRQAAPPRGWHSKAAARRSPTPTRSG